MLVMGTEKGENEVLTFDDSKVDDGELVLLQFLWCCRFGGCAPEYTLVFDGCPPHRYCDSVFI
jgi:hypothetical protein